MYRIIPITVTHNIVELKRKYIDTCRIIYRNINLKTDITLTTIKAEAMKTSTRPASLTVTSSSGLFTVYLSIGKKDSR